jgi:hypothetical protein
MDSLSLEVEDLNVLDEKVPYKKPFKKPLI